MTSKEREVLKILSKHYGINNHVESKDIKKYTKMSQNDLDAVCEYLALNGYLSNFSQRINGGCVFRTTLKSSCYAEFEFREQMDFLVKSVAFPIIISVITTLVVTALRM